MTRGGLALFVLSVLLLFARPARAQRAEVRASVDQDVVELGGTVRYTLQAMFTGASPSDPKPGDLPGFSVRGTSSAPLRMHVNVNGAQSELNGLTATWTLRATRLGSFDLGPASVRASGARHRANRVHVKVVPPGQAPQRRGPFGAFDPFSGSPLDPFKGLFDFGDDVPAPQPAAPTADPELALSTARAPIAFLHATVDKTHAVVGEQVTLTVYLYEDPYARQATPTDVHEATATDFVKKSLLEDETRAVGVGTAMVGGRLWAVKLVRKNALFPIKSGHLTIEPMSLSLPQARVGLRETERLHVDVTEPPAAGRPPGYAIGDVGDFSLSATVAPRAIDQGGALGVTLELRGTGNLPSELPLPTGRGVEWLDAQTREKVGAQRGERFGGTRTFSYVVRVHEAGEIDLGEVRLPFYDPARREYGVARAALGIVHVAPVAGAHDAGTDEEAPILPGLPEARDALERPAPRAYLSDGAYYWALVFGAPLACVLMVGGQGLVGALRRRRKDRAPAPERVARERRADAAAACKGDDAGAAISAVARAVEATVLERTAVNLRGAARDVAARELEDAGVARDAARDVLDVLRACEDARFSPEGVAMDAARDLWARAEEALERVRVTRGREEDG